MRITIGLCTVFITLFANITMAIEEPQYTVLEKDGAFELRDYQPMIIAQTLVSGSMKQASNTGFRVIADYIFGNNTVQGQADTSTKIDMTAPVSIVQQGEQWRLHFVMPSQYTLTNLPLPNNAAVSIRKVPQGRYAVLRFSGFTGEAKVAKKTKALLDWLNSQSIAPIAEPTLARYNHPWTLPFLRRNEIIVAY